MKPEQYVKLRDKLTRAEDKLLRATRAWDKARAACRRAEKALDKDFNRRSEIGGSNDIRDFLDEPISEPIHGKELKKAFKQIEKMVADIDRIVPHKE